MTYIKHLISFLLIFGLTVNECSLYSQVKSSNYHQVSYINTRKEFSPKYSELYVYGKQLPSEKLFVALLTFLNLKDFYSAKITRILNFQIERYQAISSIIAQHVFLHKKFVSSNQYTNLYIA
ncbi:hypothetical protein SAMN04489796_104255 [Winogradskyella thalassocola]|uniref:Uncharacterized protein n=1 Tax=Winogradskyella thalassocola TaxID=262004 RepID=A0A1G8FHI6_9FLAO|nr:hypothetical protein SAMN04489796_104255 [Winogradskyella thalassocola]